MRYRIYCLFFITSGVTELNFLPNRMVLHMHPADTAASAIMDKMFSAFAVEDVEAPMLRIGPKSSNNLIQILSSFLLFKSEFSELHMSQ